MSMEDPNELIVTQDNLLDIVEGLCTVGIKIGDIQNKLSEEDGKNILIPLLATIIAVIKLLPKNKKKAMIELLEENLNLDLTEIVRKIS